MNNKQNQQKATPEEKTIGQLSNELARVLGNMYYYQALYEDAMQQVGELNAEIDSLKKNK
jgi:capsule polysaccharide export protein KpsE/RkpR